MDIAAALLAVVTLAAGVAVGWLVARSRSAADGAATASDLAALRVERDAALAARDRLADEREIERQRAVAEREAERAATREELERLRTAHRGAEVRASEAMTKLAALEDGETQLKDVFLRLSQEALQTNRQQFLDLADDRFRQAGRPLTETLHKVEGQLRDIERNRAGAQAALKEQIELVRLTGDQLKAETAALVGALRKPQARGQWGELQLRKCVEYSGMLDRCDFSEQTSVTTTDGVLRPDMVVNLVGGKTVVVDSKVTLVAYLEAHETADEVARGEHLARHARHLRQHVDALAAKAYWAQFSAAPEFVIMFVPGDGPLNAALEQDPTLLEYAFTKRVQILGPMSLVPTLRAIAYAWQQQALADNAREVFELGRELYSRLGTMGGHVDKLGRSLTRAINDYNSTVGSLESKVMVTARKLNELRVVDSDLVEVEGLDATVRPLTKPELVESAEQSRAVVALPASDGPLEPMDLRGLEDYGIDAAAADPQERRTGS